MFFINVTKYVYKYKICNKKYICKLWFIIYMNTQICIWLKDINIMITMKNNCSLPKNLILFMIGEIISKYTLKLATAAA